MYIYMYMYTVKSGMPYRHSTCIIQLTSQLRQAWGNVAAWGGSPCCVPRWSMRHRMGIRSGDIGNRGVWPWTLGRLDKWLLAVRQVTGVLAAGTRGGGYMGVHVR